MEAVVVIFALALQGVLIGGLARLALPGKDPMSLLQTMGVGLAGSLLAGIVTYVITDGRSLPSFLSSLIFATLIVYVVRKRRGGGLVEPSAPQ